MINFFRLSTASMTQMSTLRHSKVICMQKQQPDMKPVFKKQMFLQFKASVIKHNHLEPWSRLLLQSCIGRRSLPWWWTLLPWCCWAWALCWSASWSSQPQTTGSRFLTRHHPGKCKQICQICCYMHLQMWFWHTEPTLTHGWSSTCAAVYLVSTSTCSIAVITA